MLIIDDPLELEKQAVNLRRWKDVDDRASVADYRQRFGKSLFEWITGGPTERASDSLRMKARNDVRFSAFPHKIEITAEIALLLYLAIEDNEQHEISFQRQHGTLSKLYLDTVILAPINIALAIFWRGSPLSAGVKAAQTASRYIEYDRAMTALIKEKQKLIEPILGNYRLSKSPCGKFLLELQPIEEGSYTLRTERGGHTTHYTKMIPGAGFDPLIKREDLPALPSPKQ